MTTSNNPLADLIAPVATLLLGEPNRKLSNKHELRYGSRGSMSIDLQKGTWFDHETSEGGGVFDLVVRCEKIELRECPRWLDEHGFPIEGYQPQAKRNGADGKPQRKIVATYDYRDSFGGLVFQVVRYDPKDFRQRRPDGQGGWVWNLHGVDLVPYKLPEIIEQMAQGRVIAIPEGEKSVERLWALGIPATCNPMGAGKWKPELAEYFADADVVIIPDYDPQKVNPKTKEPMFHDDGRPVLPGQDHAMDIARSLAPVARRVRVFDLATVWSDIQPKNDFDEWHKACGVTAEMFYALVEQAPDWSEELVLRWPAQEPAEPEIKPLRTFNASEFQGLEVPVRRWNTRDRVPMRNVTLLSGDGATGKTTIALQLAVQVATGAPDWLGALIDEPGKVLFITAEEERDEVHRRLRSITRRYGIEFSDLKDKLYLYCAPDEDCVLTVLDHKTGLLTPTKRYAELGLTIETIKPKLVIAESAADLFSGNENDRSQVRQFIRHLRSFCLHFDCAILLISHPSVAGMASGSGVSGSTGWNNSVRSRMYFTRERKKVDNKKQKHRHDDEEDVDQGDTRLLKVMKVNYAKGGDTIRVVYDDGVFVIPSPKPNYQQMVEKKPLIEAEIDELFLEALDQRNAEGRPVGAQPAKNYAPTALATMPICVRKNITSDQLSEAMERLFERRVIVTETTGPASRRRTRITRFDLLSNAGIPTQISKNVGNAAKAAPDATKAVDVTRISNASNVASNASNDVVLPTPPYTPPPSGGGLEEGGVVGSSPPTLPRGVKGGVGTRKSTAPAVGLDFTVIGPEPGKFCERCNRKDGTVYAIRARDETKTHTMHEGCASEFFKR